MVFVQNWPLFQFFILDNIAEENYIFDTLEIKNNFLGYKNNKFKKLEN